MSLGYWYMIAALLSFAGMGVTHKIGDRVKAAPLGITLVAMVSALLVSIIRASIANPAWFSNLPPRVALLALPFGVSAAVALWLFQKGLRHGHIVTSWLLINLSTAIPTALSIIVYHETLSLRKLLTMLLIVASLVLLWWDRKSAEEKQEVPQMQAVVEGR